MALKDKKYLWILFFIMVLGIGVLAKLVIYNNLNNTHVQELSIDKIKKIQNESEYEEALSVYIAKKAKYGNQMDKLNEVEKTYYLIDTFRFEILQGGFEQFFYNKSGDYTYETVEALNALKATETVSLLNKAIELYPNLPISKERSIRMEQLDQLSESNKKEFYKLEQQFYEIHSKLDKQLREYSIEHKNEIK